MKFFFTITLMFLFLYSCQESKNNFTEVDELAVKIKEEMQTHFISEEEETKAIMKVIEGETKCLYERNYECWKNYWIHSKYASHSYNESDGTYKAQLGWEEIMEEIGSIIVNKPVKNGKSLYPIVERKNVQVKFFGERAAYLFWEQYQNKGKQSLYKKSQEIRVMEKINEEWKILNLSTFWDYENMVPFEK